MPRRAAPQPHTPEEPKGPVTRLYRVTGPFRVAEVETGGLVALGLTDSQTQILIDAGHIEPVAGPGQTAVETEQE